MNRLSQEEIEAYLQSGDESERLLGQAWQRIAELEAQNAGLSWHSHHWETEGKPDGGVSYGTGFTIAWQRGSLLETGRNGAFLIEVLGVCLDELNHKDKQFPCEENKTAISHLEQCLFALNARQNRRKEQGILYAHKEAK